MYDLENRIKEAQNKFDQVKAQRDELSEELNRLQGEYRVLLELQSTANQESDKANTITVESKKEKK